MATHTTIVFTHSDGRLANQLFSQAHLLAFCLEHAPRFSLINAAILPYSNQLSGNAAIFGSPPSPLRIIATAMLGPWPNRSLAARARRKSLHGLSRLLHGRSFGGVSVLAPQTLDLGTETATLGATPIVLLSGWSIRCDSLLKKHRTEVLRRLSLAFNFTRVEGLLATTRKDCDFLIGVHMRQTDYATYNDGAHFLTSDQYASTMTAVASALAPSKIGFLICSDTTQSARTFEGVNATIATGTTPADDLTLLSRCDLIIGVSSTFNVWASFISDAPLHWLDIPDADRRKFPENVRQVLMNRR